MVNHGKPILETGTAVYGSGTVLSSFHVNNLRRMPFLICGARWSIIGQIGCRVNDRSEEPSELKQKPALKHLAAHVHV